jgi:6-phospho-beta-glucosidase
MKVTVIGGGSTYTPELVNGFLARAKTFPLSELCLMDIQKSRLDIVGGFAQRMVSAAGSPFEVTLSTDQREAIRGAVYVITQLRVGLMEARRADVYLGQRHGLIGQETTGVGGMAKALRTIPVMMSIADDMRSVAPGALLANFTNPAGLITEALSRYAPDIQAVGVCNVPITAKMMLLESLETLRNTPIKPERARLDTLGLNHLTWHRGFTIDGVNVWDQVLDGFLDELRASEQPEWDLDTITSLQMIPNYYLQYYYYTDHKLSLQGHWPPSRADEVIAIEKDLLQEYGDPTRSTPPENLMQRGGAYYSTLATQLLNAHFNDLGETHILNIKQGGAVADWPADWVLEMPCRVDQNGVHPEPTEALPPVCAGLVAQVKSYEVLAARAGVFGDRQAAYQALLAHPLGPPADRVQAVFEDMLAINAPHLPQFRNKKV